MNRKLLAGQRLILGFNGTEFNDDLKHIIGDLKACGIILFKQNVQTPKQVRSLCDACQAYAKSKGLPPLIVCTDQEGGVVARFREHFTLFKGNPSIKSIPDAVNFARITANELGQVGINMNLAPVLDIVPDGVDSIMKDRAFPGDEKNVSRLGTAIISTLQKKGMMAVAKHFPGIGKTIKDSHHHLPILDTDLESLRQSDMVPFADAIKQDVSGIMLSHIFYPQLDSQWQASLSPIMVNDILRSQLGYEGMVFTDDLDMKAIQLDIRTCVRQILTAGVDISLICHKGPNIELAWQEIINLQHQDDNLYAFGKKSVDRILRYKQIYLQ